MSMELMVKAMKIHVGNPLRKLVLIKLADNANDNGECWPSYQHIADQCEIARSTVKVHIRELEKAGLLRREFRRNGEVNQSNVFHLTLDAADNPGGGAADNPGGGAADNRGGAADNPGGGAADNPRTSHSSEPVMEPKKRAAAPTDAENPPPAPRTIPTKAKAAKPEASLPEWLPADAWADFVDMRVKLRAPMTERAKSLMLRKLDDLRLLGHDPRAVIEQSIMHGWKGVFPIKGAHGGGGVSRQASIEARNRQAAEEFINGGDWQ